MSGPIVMDDGGGGSSGPIQLVIRYAAATGTPKTCKITANTSDTLASLIQKIIVKEQFDYATPDMFRLVRCGSTAKKRDGSEPVHASLPRSGVLDVLSRTVRDYGLCDGDALAVQDAHLHKSTAFSGTKISMY